VETSASVTNSPSRRIAAKVHARAMSRKSFRSSSVFARAAHRTHSFAYSRYSLPVATTRLHAGIPSSLYLSAPETRARYVSGQIPKFSPVSKKGPVPVLRPSFDWLFCRSVACLTPHLPSQLDWRETSTRPPFHEELSGILGWEFLRLFSNSAERNPRIRLICRLSIPSQFTSLDDSEAAPAKF
jgi:hypothetical protein